MIRRCGHGQAARVGMDGYRLTVWLVCVRVGTDKLLESGSDQQWA